MDGFEYTNPGDLPPEEAEKIQAKVEQLTEASRKIGLYVESVMVTEMAGPGGFPQRAFVVSYALGDVAFTQRVQDPAEDVVTKQFEELAADFHKDDFQAARERMQRNIEAGRSALDDGDELS